MKFQWCGDRPVHDATNCLVFALDRYWHRGGYLIIRRSTYGWWPHFLWSQDLIEFEEFTTDSKFRRWCPPLIFKGYVRMWRPEEILHA